MPETFKSKPYYYQLYGDRALFTDVLTKGGGEKFTYQVPTYQALKGITEQIYWKPTLIHYIDAIIVLNEIRTEAMATRPVVKKGQSNDLSYYTYLRKVNYLVKGHFEWNLQRNTLASDRNGKKHQAIFERSLHRGGRRDIFLGTRECMGFVEPITPEEFSTKDSYYNGQELSLGLMFHSFTYPDENPEKNEELISNFDHYILKDGKITFNRPLNTPIHHHVNDYQFKNFTLGENISQKE